MKNSFLNYSFYLIPFVIVKRLFRSLVFEVGIPLRTKMLARVWRMNCGKRVQFVGPVVIRSYDRGAIVLGNDVMVMSKINQNLVGLMNPTILCAHRGAKIVIGDHTGLSSPIINARERVEIGRYVKVGGNVRIFDNDFHGLEWQSRRPPHAGEMIRTKPVVIEDDCFIGTNAIILKGSHIGARSIVAAGSVVFGLNVPPDSMVKGNPAVIIPRKGRE